MKKFSKTLFNGILTALALLIVVPLFLVILFVGSPFFIIWYRIYISREKRKYANSGCPLPYQPMITKSTVFQMFKLLTCHGLTSELWQDDQFEYLLCPEKQRCFLITEYDNLCYDQLSEENGRLFIRYFKPKNDDPDGDEEETEEIIDLSAHIAQIEQEKHCTCYICYDSGKSETVDIDIPSEPWKARIIDIAAPDAIKILLK